MRNLLAVLLLSFATGALAANQAPVVQSITAPPHGVLTPVGSSVTFTAIASDSDGSVTKVEYFNGSTPIGNASSAPWTVLWTPAAAGTFSITAKATDNQSKVGSASAAVQVRVFNVTTTITNPAPNATIPVGSVTVTGTIQNPVGTETVIVTAGGGHSVVASLSGGNYSAVVPVSAGTNAIEVQTARRNGTSEFMSITVTGQATPVVALTQPTSCGPYAPGTAITVTADAAVENGTISSVQFYDNGVAFGSPVTSPPYTISRTLTTTGQHSFTATATAGPLTSPPSAPLVVNCASTNAPPTVQLTSPSHGATFTAPANITVTATASDPDGSVNHVKFLVNNQVQETDSTSPYTFSWTNVQQGTYQLKAIAVDNELAEGESSVIQVTVNAPPPNQPPTVTLLAPANNSTWPAPLTTTITSDPIDPDGTVASVAYFINGVMLGSSSTGPNFSVPWADAQPGIYRITAVATDNNNLSGPPSPEFVVNVAVPTEVGETIVYLHNDFAGNPIAGTSTTGAVLWKEQYRPFGDRVTRDPVANSNRQWFGGKAEDAETGLSYFGARYYDPVMGRFTSVDPKGFEATDIHTFNRYAYANNNPYKFRDPDGRAVDFILDAAFIVYDSGRFLGAFGAWAVGAVTGDTALAAAGKAGMQETGLDFAMSAGSAAVPGLSAPMVRGGTKLVGSGVDLTVKEGNHVIGTFKTAKGEAQFYTEMIREGDSLILRGTHIQGDATLKEALATAKAFGKEQGAKKVVIEGGRRTTGANPGHVPRHIELDTGL